MKAKFKLLFPLLALFVAFGCQDKSSEVIESASSENIISAETPLDLLTENAKSIDVNETTGIITIVLKNGEVQKSPLNGSSEDTRVSDYDEPVEGESSIPGYGPRPTVKHRATVRCRNGYVYQISNLSSTISGGGSSTASDGTVTTISAVISSQNNYYSGNMITWSGTVTETITTQKPNKPSTTTTNTSNYSHTATASCSL